jgi:diketogulonate reductase-like aldo/keto reductase
MPIGIGTMGFAGGFQRDSSSLRDFSELIEYGFNNGCSIVDTAEIYAEGGAEESIGLVAKTIRDRLFIMSKFSPDKNTPAKIRMALEETLRRIKRECIDVYQPHWPVPDLDFDVMMEVLVELKKEGKLLNIGLSNHGLRFFKSNQSNFTECIKFAQTEFNPVSQDLALDIISEIKPRNGILVGYSPFREGQLLQGQGKNLKLFEIAMDYKCSPAQLILSWIIQHRNVVAIPKSSSKKRIKENLESINLRISPSDTKEIGYLFKEQIDLISPKKINPVGNVGGDRKIYKNLEEAVENRYFLSPGVKEIAEEIKMAGDLLLKPIKVRLSKDAEYELIEGRLRYWAWIMLYGDARPIQAIIVE